VLDLAHLSPDDGHKVGSGGSSPNPVNAAAFSTDGAGQMLMSADAFGLEHLSQSHPILNHDMMPV
jgi:hypothetical protein